MSLQLSLLKLSMNESHLHTDEDERQDKQRERKFLNEHPQQRSWWLRITLTIPIEQLQPRDNNDIHV